LANGNCDVPISFVESKTGFHLGKWLRVIRQKRTTIPAEKARELESLGIVWDLKESRWIRGYESLCKFKTSFGHCLVPARYVDESGFKLGQWVTVTRNKAAKVPKKKRALLDDIGFVWKARERT
jgi:hypothetical protein